MKPFSELIQDWVNLPDFSHGFFIPFISLYLVWERRNQLYEILPTPSIIGGGILIVGLLLLIAGNLAAEMFTMRFSFLIVLSGIVIFLHGWTMFKKLIFPIGFLFFMIPLPSILLQKITFPMQLFASKVSVGVMEILGIPVFRSGNVIHLPNTSLEVAEACSGLRSLISLLAMGAIYAYLTQKRLWTQALLFLSTIPVAVISNAFRVFITALITYATGVDTSPTYWKCA